MPVEIFSRLAHGPTDAAEQLVLQRVLSVIDRRDEDAVILVNLFHRRHEIDLIVATQTATLVIEIKGYLQPVEGDINSLSWTTVATGERRSNAYAKIDSAHMNLKDALREMTGADPGYAHAVVLLAYGRPMGSNVPASDHRVTITGIEALESLLSTPVRPGTLRRLWSLDAVREFAKMKRLALMSTAATARSATVGVTRYAEVTRELRRPGVMPGSMPPANDLSVPLVLEATPIRRPQKRSWLRAAILLFIGLPVLVGGVSALLHRPGDGVSKVASTPRHTHEPIRRHGVKEATRRRRSEQAQEDRDESSSALLAAQQANEQALAAHSVQPTPAALMPPCPPGIDRLGCVPDPQTLAKLRH
ncbi:NERD domain-containing protein [Trinickia sp. NRRL B-1857]|uniref:NERD domain-containing protein n=1 Tax=Trinickia sp. NRRL B-1857 TaxID=3162879 RepID=UPI003D2D976D